MGKEARYQVIISDKAKRMIGMHIRRSAEKQQTIRSEK